MPELPEVEVTCRGLMPHVLGQSILAVRLGKPLRWPLGCAPSLLIGQKVEKLYRRGKYLIFQLSAGYLLVHLGMSGRFVVCDVEVPMAPHEHFEIKTAIACVRLHDPRRFGAVVFVESLEQGIAGKLLGKLGAEPLSGDFRLDEFAEDCMSSRQSIKSLLLSGRSVVGLGNIYVCEALHAAGIRPETAANQVSFDKLKALYEATREILLRAIEQGGSTLKDFSHANGEKGAYQSGARVYGREGLPCRVCGSLVLRVVQNQRSTFFCNECQC